MCSTDVRNMSNCNQGSYTFKCHSFLTEIPLKVSGYKAVMYHVNTGSGVAAGCGTMGDDLSEMYSDEESVGLESVGLQSVGLQSIHLESDESESDIELYMSQSDSDVDLEGTRCDRDPDYDESDVDIYESEHDEDLNRTGSDRDEGDVGSVKTRPSEISHERLVKVVNIVNQNVSDKLSTDCFELSPGCHYDNMYDKSTASTRGSFRDVTETTVTETTVTETTSLYSNDNDEVDVVDNAHSRVNAGVVSHQEHPVSRADHKTSQQFRIEIDVCKQETVEYDGYSHNVQSDTRVTEESSRRSHKDTKSSSRGFTINRSLERVHDSGRNNGASPYDGGRNNGASLYDGGRNTGASLYDGGRNNGASLYDGGRNNGASLYDGGRNTGASLYDGGRNNGASLYDGGRNNGASLYDGGRNTGASLYDGGRNTGASLYDGGRDNGASLYDGGRDNGTSLYDGGRNTGTSLYDGGRDNGTSLYDGGRNTRTSLISGTSSFSAELNISQLPAVGQKLTRYSVDEDFATMPVNSSTPYTDVIQCRRKSSRVRRPLNAFMLFAMRERRKIASENPDTKHPDISRILGVLWRSLGEEDKTCYITESKRLKILHHLEYPDYRYRPQRRRKRKKNGDVHGGDMSSARRGKQISGCSDQTPVVSRVSVPWHQPAVLDAGDRETAEDYRCFILHDDTRDPRAYMDVSARFSDGAYSNGQMFSRRIATSPTYGTIADSSSANSRMACSDIYSPFTVANAGIVSNNMPNNVPHNVTTNVTHNTYPPPRGCHDVESLQLIDGSSISSSAPEVSKRDPTIGVPWKIGPRMRNTGITSPW